MTSGLELNTHSQLYYADKLDVGINGGRQEGIVLCRVEVSPVNMVSSKANCTGRTGRNTFV